MAIKTRTRQEIDDTTIRRANRIFITSRETVCVNESNIFRAVRDKITSWDSVHEIADLLLDRIPGRTDDRQITLCISSKEQVSWTLLSELSP